MILLAVFGCGVVGGGRGMGATWGNAGALWHWHKSFRGNHTGQYVPTKMVPITQPDHIEWGAVVLVVAVYFFFCSADEA